MDKNEEQYDLEKQIEEINKNITENNKEIKTLEKISREHNEQKQKEIEEFNKNISEHDKIIETLKKISQNTKEKRKNLLSKKIHIIKKKHTQLYRILNTCTDRRNDPYWRDNILYTNMQVAKKTCHSFQDDNCIWTQSVEVYNLADNNDNNNDIELVENIN